ncbi:uncharacterized protein EDB91DRAFT_422726 [Suillus paluster]|uniref:uncharacterized protein n=1 Tax=Suillus paluster TaxID=48578 RepID=UPI001B87F89E|nr:uncharacterized protein EDB91DRAFT_422726 [Suillus paluster]KAG1753882.1 hypothetical protein EDB91DRAFT_422726 [Suillus paluster]
MYDGYVTETCGIRSPLLSAAKSLQTSKYIYLSMATYWTYGYACSLHEEWTFLLRSRWSKVKVLYIVTRYIPFLLFTGHLYMNFTPDENPNKCQMLDTVCSCFSLISVTCSECFFVLRTYVLWNNNRIVLTVLLAAFLAVAVSSVGLFFGSSGTVPYQTSTIPGITGCYRPSSGIGFFVPFILLSAFELGLISLTLIRTLQSWRTANNHLFAVLVKHNIFYYACGLFCSAVNILTSLLLHNAYMDMFQDFQFIILAILATHMHLYLWHMDRDLHGSDTLTPIPLSEMSYGSRVVAGRSSVESVGGPGAVTGFDI